jgi:hypothetical protein
MRPRSYTNEQNRSLDDLTNLIDVAQADRQAAFNRGFYWGAISGSTFMCFVASLIWAIQ